MLSSLYWWGRGLIMKIHIYLNFESYNIWSYFVVWDAHGFCVHLMRFIQGGWCGYPWIDSPLKDDYNRILHEGRNCITFYCLLRILHGGYEFSSCINEWSFDYEFLLASLCIFTILIYRILSFADFSCLMWVGNY